MSEAALTSLRKAKAPGRISIICPVCRDRLTFSGTSQDWGNLRHHFNDHIRHGEMTETEKVKYLKERGI